MNYAIFPSSRDIYLELDGKKLAAVQSYSVKAVRQTKLISAFGESQPVGVAVGAASYHISITRLYALSETICDGIDLAAVDGFSLVVVKPDRRIVYSGCRWCETEESCKLGENALENVDIIALSRTETEI